MKNQRFIPNFLFHFFSIVLLAVVFSSCVRERAPLGTEKNPIKFFFVPSIDTELIQEKVKFLKKYLEKETGYFVDVLVPTNYITVVEAFGTKRADFAVINTFGYLLAHKKYKAQVALVITRFKLSTYRSQIIVRADGPIKTVKDLEGKKFAFVDPASTSGYMLPTYFLKKKNIKLGDTVFAKRHDNVVTMVYQGQVDAGAAFYSPPEKGAIQDARRLVRTQYPDVEKKIKILTLTDAVPNDPVIYRYGLEEGMKEKVIGTLLKYMDTVEGKDVLHSLYGFTGMKKADNSTYDEVRSMLNMIGEDPEKLLKK